MPTTRIQVTMQSAALGTPSPMTYDIDDTEMQLVLDWAAGSYAQKIQEHYYPDHKPSDPPIEPTVPQIFSAWVDGWITGTETAAMQFHRPAPAAPPVVDFMPKSKLATEIEGGNE